MAECAAMKVDASTDVESDAFWARLARHTGSFTVQRRDGSIHVVRWDPPPNRSSVAGAIGYYKHVAQISEGPSIKMDGYKCRTHVCRQAPCIADYHPSKYGGMPPPAAHCRPLRLDEPAVAASEAPAPAEAGEERVDNNSKPLPMMPHSDSEEPSPEELAVVSPDVEITIPAAVPSIPAVCEADAQAIATRADAVGRPRQCPSTSLHSQRCDVGIC